MIASIASIALREGSSQVISRVALLSLGLATAACGGGTATPAPIAKAGTNAAAAGPTGKSGTTTAPAQPELKPVAEAKPAIEPHAPKVELNPKAAQDAKTFNEALAAGRAAVKARKLPEAIDHFQRALAVDPNHPGVLGELGWAAFLRNDFALSRAATGAALIYVRDARRKGALLYNLGRVCESEGNEQLAMDHYRHSLTLRDNEIVKQRLAKLEEANTGEDAARPEVEGAAGAPKVGVEGLCEQFLAESLCGMKEADCKCAIDRQIQSSTAGAPIAEAAIARAHGTVAGMGEIDDAELLVKTATGSWQAVEIIGDGSVPGVSYIQNNFEILKFEFVQLIEGGPEELSLIVRQESTDGDYGDNALEYARDVIQWVCFSDEGAASCLRFPLESFWGLERMLDDGPAPSGTTGESGWRVNATFGPHTITFGVVEGADAMADRGSLVGEKEWTSAHEDPSIEKIPLR
jgi:tetratricopeptide (TPR) repeat protein